MAESSRLITGESPSQKQAITAVSGNSKNITINFKQGNNFHLPLEKNTTIGASNLPGASSATTATIITEQPAVGFYSITWSNAFIWPTIQLGSRGGPNATLAPAAIDVFTVVSSPDIAFGEKLLGVSASNFY